MNRISFWYEIHEDAGVAYERATGENAKAHTHVDISFGRTLTTEEFAILHEEEVRDLLATQLNTDKSNLKPISYETYLANTKGETGIHFVQSKLNVEKENTP